MPIEYKDPTTGATIYVPTEEEKNKLGEQKEITPKLNELDSRVINPDNYIGDDQQKLQQAVADCMSAKGAKFVQLYRIYDITGKSPILYNRGDNRYPLRITGGGIKKTDKGFFFDSDVSDSSDMYLDNVYFESVQNSGATIFNCDRLIRIHTTNCQFRGVDCIAKTSDGKVTQSYRSIGDTIFSGKGWAFDFATTYDVVIDNLTMEQRENGVRLRENVYNTRITNSVLEGLTGTAVNIVSSTTLFTFENNYFENNKIGNLVFDENCYMRGVTVTGNSLHNSGSGWADYMVVWGSKADSVNSSGNTGSYAGVHNATKVAQGVIFSTNDSYANDKPNIDPRDSIYVLRSSSYKEITGGYRTDLGQFRRYTVRSTTNSFVANTTSLLEVEFPVAVHQDDIVSIQCFARIENIAVDNWWREGNKIVIRVTNRDNVNRNNVFFSVTILQPVITITG